PTLRLAIIPRHPQRFDEVAGLIRSTGFSLVLRSQSTPTTSSSNPAVPAVILGDTMGELRKFYSLAGVVFIGRTLVDLGPRQAGSDMIEPAALAKPVIVGPYTANFAEVMRCLSEADAVRVAGSGGALRRQVESLLASPADALAMGRRAQEVVRHEQGATARNVDVIL